VAHTFLLLHVPLLLLFCASQFKYEDAKGKVRVYARVRPFSKAEIAAEEKTLLRPGTNEWTLAINETQKNYQGIVSDNWRPIEFDHVFQFGLENTKGNASQLEIFEETKIFAELTVQGQERHNRRQR
jgi:hypothetical protein